MRIILCFIAALYIALMSSAVYADPKPLDSIVAVVNSQVITESQLRQQMRITHSPRKAALDQLIEKALQVDLAKKANLAVTDAQVDDAIAKIAAQNSISPSQLQASLAAQGMDYATYRRQIHDELVLHQVQQSVIASKVKVTPQDIEAAKNMPQAVPARAPSSDNAQYHVIDILVSSPAAAQALLSKIKSGENPNKLLKDNPAVKMNDLGFRRLSQFPDIFIKPVQALNQGQFSEVIKAPNGSHILNLLAVKGQPAIAMQPPLTPEQIAYQQKAQEAVQKWLQTMRSQSYVKIIKTE